MDLSFAALREDYATRLAVWKPHLRPGQGDPHKVAQDLLVHKDRFLALQSLCGVPALWVMPVFEREEPRFDRYLGNGDRLDHPTTHVPRGRGPFASWEEGAVDALKLDHITAVTSWSWQMACYEWERWNGFGPREHGRETGYNWSGTDQYEGGKYTGDGVWSRGTWDVQLGCVIVAKAIAELDPEIGAGFG